METRRAGSALVGREGLGVVEGPRERELELALTADWAAASSSCMFKSDTRLVVVTGVRQVAGLPAWGTGVAGPGLGLPPERGFSSSPARKTERAPYPQNPHGLLVKPAKFHPVQQSSCRVPRAHCQITCHYFKNTQAAPSCAVSPLAIFPILKSCP